jgi:hypothetical protein
LKDSRDRNGSIWTPTEIHSLSIAGPPIHREPGANQIQGLMLDMTFSVMRNYMTAILVAVSHNTAIPLAFAFGPVESFELYEFLSRTFKTRDQISLSEFTVESDQGSSLQKFYSIHHIRHRFCLRHFLASLKDRLFACSV